MDERPSEKEIIKGLEYCGCDDYCGGCECPYYLNSSCMKALACDALSLINRQKAEIIRLKNKNSKVRNERNRARAEAIKEFAERLKLRFHPENVNTLWLIDDLVKEMVGVHDE